VTISEQTDAERLKAMRAALPSADTVPAEAFMLAEAVRDLVEATVMTDVSPAERAAVATELRALSARLGVAERPDPVWVVSHGGDDWEHLTNAGTGRLNPNAPRVQWLTPDGEIAYDATPDENGEVRARCTLTQAHVGPPQRAHGGVVATILDQVVGFAASAVDKPGMTAGLDIRYKKATPYGVPLMIHARYTHSEGRKHFATGEIIADGEITASAFGVFIGHPDQSGSQ
jgi:acyl-coenzyme A thioesterase PaaI-like protein